MAESFGAPLDSGVVSLPRNISDLHNQKAPSSGWAFEIAGNQSPLTRRFIAVDKSRQKIMLYEHNSPLRLVSSFTCTTGQVTGDKTTEGDLRTPEGIYFVTRKISGGLNYELYGNEAYTLNYPNPVDKLRRKTGYGIWIHGRGYEISPQETKGCVALNNGDLAVFGKELKPGTPVALADAVAEAGSFSSKDEHLVKTLRSLVKDWSAAWEARSTRMFDFYDQAAYSLTQESFLKFKLQKERLFKSLAWIKNEISNVHVLKGPGYWVTWFAQDYKAPNMETKGVRRLYWQENNVGQLRIVGMEWLPGQTLDGSVMLADASDDSVAVVGMLEERNQLLAEGDPASAKPEKKGKENLTLAVKPVKESVNPLKTKVSEAEVLSEAEVRSFVEFWRQAWESGDLNAYIKFYAANAEQGSRKGQAAIKNQKAALWKKAKPTDVYLSDIKTLSKGGEIIVLEMTQSFQDSSGHGDKGIKTLHLKVSGKKIEIIREDWRKWHS